VVAIDVGGIKRRIADLGQRLFRLCAQDDPFLCRELGPLHRLGENLVESRAGDIGRLVPIIQMLPWINQVIALDRWAAFQDGFGKLAAPNTDLSEIFYLSLIYEIYPEIDVRRGRRHHGP
jgi:hypothetical protein